MGEYCAAPLFCSPRPPAAATTRLDRPPPPRPPSRHHRPATSSAPGRHLLPHVYSNGDLRLYLPGQWNESMLLADTILPWTSQWLLYYELWLITGHWVGSGHTTRPTRGSLK